MCDYKESVTTGQTDTHTHTDAGQSDPYVLLCFAGDTINVKEENKVKYIKYGQKYRIAGNFCGVFNSAILRFLSETAKLKTAEYFSCTILSPVTIRRGRHDLGQYLICITSILHINHYTYLCTFRLID